jgi:hypothetical protein
MKKDQQHEWVVLFYRTDKMGITRKTKIGKAFTKRDNVINVSLEALPLVNQHGECWITLAPYNPDYIEEDDYE